MLRGTLEKPFDAVSGAGGGMAPAGAGLNSVGVLVQHCSFHSLAKHRLEALCHEY